MVHAGPGAFLLYRQPTVGCMTDRLVRLRTALRELSPAPAAMLVQNPVNTGYLTGFSGSSAMLLVTPDEAVLVTDSRYAEQAAAECPGCHLIVTTPQLGYEAVVARQIAARDLPTIGVEADYLTLSGLEALREAYTRLEPPRDPPELHPLKGLVAQLRQIKDEAELAAIRAACALADQTFAHILGQIKPGVSERDLAAELEYFMKRRGSDGVAFETIVASGPRSALPHGRAGSRVLARGDLVTLDFGARVAGYCSDLTRTVVLGRASARQTEVYSTVLNAQSAAIAAIRAGVEGSEVDRVARDLIASRGFGDYFGHGLGHGLGRVVHDHPALSPRQAPVLRAGMVVTVEPGVYIPGWGGVRIEEDVLVTEAGCEVLTSAPRELLELPG